MSQQIKDIGSYFQYNDHIDAETISFKIVKGRYRGVEFEYLNARPEVDENNDICNMNYDLKFFNIPEEYTEADLIKQHHFKQLSGQWLEEQLRIYFNSEPK